MRNFVRMKNELYLSGDVGFEISLKNVVAEFKANPEIKDVFINSPGGVVSEGVAIYNFLKDKQINTHGIGRVASIATVIFLAGKERTIHSTDDFLIHFPMTMAGGTAQDLEKTANELRDLEQKLAKIYASETLLSIDQALNQMQKDEWVDSDWLKENGFITKTKEFKAVAIINNFNNKNMELTKNDKSWFDSQFEKLGQLFSGTDATAEVVVEATNKVVQDAAGISLDFYELDSDARVKIGDKANDEEGKPITGDHLMPSGVTYVFESGDLKEIKPKANALEEENEKLKTALAESEANVAKSIEQLADANKDFLAFKDELKSKFTYNNKKSDDNKNEVQLLKLR